MHLVTLKDLFPLNFSSLSLIQCKRLALTLSPGKKLCKCNKHCVKYHLLLLFVLKMVVVNCIWHSPVFVLGDLKSSHTLLPCLCSSCFCDSSCVASFSHWLAFYLSEGQTSVPHTDAIPCHVIQKTRFVSGSLAPEVKKITSELYLWCFIVCFLALQEKPECMNWMQLLQWDLLNREGEAIWDVWAIVYIPLDSSHKSSGLPSTKSKMRAETSQQDPFLREPQPGHRI